MEGYDIREHVKMFKDGMSAEERPPRPPTFGGAIKKKEKKNDAQTEDDDIEIDATSAPMLATE